MIIVPNRSTSVRSVHRPQAIVILASHVSSENLCRLYDTTMRDAIFYRAPRPHSNCARSLSRVFNLYLPLFFRGLAPPVIVATIQPKICETSIILNEGGYRDGKL